MLKKSIVIGTAALAFGMIGVFANGCSSSSTSSTGTTGDSGSKTDGSKIVPDGSDTPDSGPACYADSPLANPFPWGAPVLHQNLCTSTQIQGYYDSCMAAQEAGVDAGGVCNDFVVANVACTQCIIGPLNPAVVPDASADAATSGYPAPVTYDGQSYSYLNVAACLAAISTSGGDATCTTNYTGLNDCAAVECEGCLAGDDANDTATTACENYALNDATVCGASYPVTSACDAAVTAVSDADATSKCGLSSTGTFEQGFIGIATAFCGAP
jgi:hypothetical protein